MLRHYTTLLAFATTFLFVNSPLIAAEPESPPKTLAEQIAYLEGALSEGIQTRDFAMLEMAVNGFKAAKLSETDLELSILRGERNAAWAPPQMYGATDPGALETWGLLTRALLGNAQALASLRENITYAPATPPPAPQYGNKLDQPKEFLAKQKAYNEHTSKIKKRDQSLLALALLKEPGIKGKAMALIEGARKDDTTQMQYYAGMDPLVQAVILSDPNGGFQALADYCSGDKFPVAEQATMLSKLNALYTPSIVAEDKFSVSQEVRHLAPKDGQKKLVDAYVGLLRRYEPPKGQQAWDVTLNTLSNIGMLLPHNSLPAEGIAAVEALIEKLPGDKNQYPKPNFVSILKRNGHETVKPPKSNSPVKPPAPPEKNQF